MILATVQLRIILFTSFMSGFYDESVLKSRLNYQVSKDWVRIAVSLLKFTLCLCHVFISGMRVAIV